jgi:hypothetical protein
MEKEEQAAQASEEQEEEETTEEAQEEKQEESVDDLKALLAKAEEERENQKKRAEKAEKLAKQNKPTAKEEGTLSTTDVLYLAKSDVHDDDIEYLTTLAKNNKLSLKEAHAQFKPLLDVRNEERKTADATQTGSGRGKKPATGEEYLRKAQETGEVPTTDKGMQELILARQNRFKKK